MNTPKDYKEKYGINHSPLHLAALLDDCAEIVPLLIEKGKAEVDVRAHMQPFFTPLQLSAAIGKVEMVEALLRYGADPRKTVNLSDPESCVSVFHLNALDLARHMKHDDVVAALEKHNVNALNISLRIYSEHTSQ